MEDVTFGSMGRSAAGRTIGSMERKIQASVSVLASLDQLRKFLAAPCSVLSETPLYRQDGSHHTVLTVEVGAGASVRQEVLIDAGPLETTDTGAKLPLRWRAAGRPHLFPTFAGELEVEPDGKGARLMLRGSYIVPLGPIGTLGDEFAGRRLARQSLATYLQDIAARIDAEVTEAGAISDPPPEVHEVTPRETVGSENYLG